jgi:hypothetical protein
MARLNQTLLHKVAKKLDKTPERVREQVSRRASREAVSSDVALIMWARGLGIGVASALNKVPPAVQQQLTVPRVVAPRPVRPARKPRPARSLKGGTWIFISHATDDKVLAGALVELLSKAFTLGSDKILCTSVDGYRLRGGADLDEELRRAVLAAKTVVGIVSPTSRKSTYVQMELGARWATRKHMIPVTAGGVSPGDVRGPVGRLVALNLSSRPSVLQLIGDLATELKVAADRADALDKYIGRLIQASRAAGKRRKRKG